MADSERWQGRPHDAKAAQAAILNAAENVFAEHGFSGARIDAIAAAAGYNKSLIFHYFGDKLGLYIAVLMKSEEQGNRMQEEAFGPLLNDPTITSDKRRFRSFLEMAVGLMFDFFVAHPKFLRIYMWEQAEGWKTFKTIWSRFDHADEGLMMAMADQAQRAGVLRPGISPHLILDVTFGTCVTYLASLPLFQLIAPDEDLSKPEALAQAREQIVAFVVNGMVAD